MTDAADKQTQKDPGLAGLVLMLPILILQFVFARFARRLDRLKQARRTRPSPRNWRDHFGRLRQCEWHIHQLVANGARQVLAFGDVDLNFIPMIVDVPEDMAWSEPSSPAALYIRMQEIARFHSDPERYILRHATRIRKREADAADLILRSAEGASRRMPATRISSSSSIENAAAEYYYAAQARGPPQSTQFGKTTPTPTR